MTSKKKFSEHIDKHYVNLVEKINNRIAMVNGKPLISRESIKMAKQHIKENITFTLDDIQKVWMHSYNENFKKEYSGFVTLLLQYKETNQLKSETKDGAEQLELQF